MCACTSTAVTDDHPQGFFLTWPVHMSAVAAAEPSQRLLRSRRFKLDSAGLHVLTLPWLNSGEPVEPCFPNLGIMSMSTSHNPLRSPMQRSHGIFTFNMTLQNSKLARRRALPTSHPKRLDEGL